jgi:beta-glucosidase
MQGHIRPPESRFYTLTLSLIGRGRLLIDQELILDLWDGPSSNQQNEITLKLDANRTYSFIIEYVSDLDLRWRMVHLGIVPSETPDLLQDAVELAAESDIAIIVAGLTPEWESEGFDRETLALPGKQDTLIREVLKVNPSTIVILNSGSQVAMPWLDDVPAVLQAWYLGQESGNSIRDVIFGYADPGGRLPTTFVSDLKDSPTFGNFPGEAGKVHYQEGIFVGYRHFDSKGIQPLFPFGHGLSYTSFKHHNLRMNQSSFQSGSKIEIKVDVTNTGARAGKEVIQLYLRDLESSLPRPFQELKGFKKIGLVPGETKTVSFTLDESDLSYYDHNRKGWVSEDGDFEILIGRSTANILLTSRFHWESLL